MTTLTARSVLYGACTALLIAGIAGPASAEGTDAPPYSVPTHKGTGNMTITGNSNSTAGNDLIIGNNNTSGTGHTIGATAPRDRPDFSITNSSNTDLVFLSPASCSACQLVDTSNNAIEGPFPYGLPRNVNAVGFFDATGNTATVTLQYRGSDRQMHNLTVLYNNVAGTVSCGQVPTPDVICTVASQTPPQINILTGS
ncbi:hypothetical protein ACFV16_37970 [Streptomyces massasporeus]|uniref:hypothetical protein n=1 Tax=Streptomyces massasporeus TaxID=67324 RepID=UPI003690246A